MSWHLCTLKDGVDLAKKLAKKSGLLNYQLTDTEYVTEEFIEEGIKNCSETLRNHEATKWDLEMACYYEDLFRSYCLYHLGPNRLQSRITTKFESYYKQIK